MSASDELLQRVKSLSTQQRQWLAKRLEDDQITSDRPLRLELTAWVICDQQPMDQQAIRKALISRLPGALIPKRILQVQSLPRTSTGKLDRGKLELISVDAASTLGFEHSESRQNLRQFASRATPSKLLTNSATQEQTCSALIEVCRNLLADDLVSEDDNFFEIGGDSLLSIQLIARARAIGLELTPKDIVHSKNLGELALIAEQRQSDQSKLEPVASSGFKQGSSIKHLLPLHIGDGSGSILLIHDVGGDCGYAHHLASLLDQRISVHACHQPEAQHAANTIEELASLYIHEWLSLDLPGPRVVMGYCWGGVLAFEITRQLKALNIPLERLVIVESGTEAAYQHASLLDRTLDRARGVSYRLHRRFQTVGDQAWWRILSDMARVFGTKLARRVGISLGRTAELDAETSPEQQRIDRNVEAFLDYTSAQMSVPTTLLRTGSDSRLIGTTYSNQSFGWSYLIPDGLRIGMIPGDHHSCMSPPHVEHLAAAINREFFQSGTDALQFER